MENLILAKMNQATAKPQFITAAFATKTIED